MMPTMAQFSYTDLDTIVRRDTHCYYSVWYDSCPIYLHDNAEYHFCDFSNYLPKSYIAVEDYAHGQMAIKGIAAMVSRNYTSFTQEIYYPYRLPEYVYLATGDTHYISIIDSTRWDTLTPYFYKIPVNHKADSIGDAAGYLSCYLYEAYFNEPILVNDKFIMAGSFNSNGSSYLSHTYKYIPTEYTCIIEPKVPCYNECDTGLARELFMFSELQKIMDLDPNQAKLRVGPFLAIVDYYQLDVVSSDSTMGSVSGSGRFPAMSLDTVRAVPHESYRFVGWSDGVTQSTRVVTLTHDTLLTAFFDTDADDTTAIVAAEMTPLAFTVTPNPATRTITVGTGNSAYHTLTLYDATGRRLWQTSFNGDTATFDVGTLPAGTYYIALRSAESSGIKAFIKQ